MLRTATLLRERQIIQMSFPITDKEVMRELCRLPHFVQHGSEWEIHPSKEVIHILRKLKFEFSRSLENWSENGQHEIENNKHTIHTVDTKLKLYQFQLEGVNFVEQKNGRALIADEMGLGKTIQAIAWMQHHPENRPALILCPSAMKKQWEREVLKWMTNVRPNVLQGTKPYAITGNIIIINFDILHYWLAELKIREFNTIVVDEAQKIKSNTAKRTKAFKKLIKSVDHVIALSGTPVENRPSEFYNIIHAINPTLFPNYMEFVQEFCGAKKTRFGWDVNGATNTKRLNTILKNSIMIRRKKEDVLKDLPPKQFVKIVIEIDNRRIYQKAENEFIQYIHDKYNRDMGKEVENELKQFAKDNKINVSDNLTSQEIQLLKMEKIMRVQSAPILTQIETLKQLSIEGKMNQIIDWIETFLESDEKLVVFAIHKKTIEQLIKHFPKAVKITGGMTDKQKDIAQTSFQNDPKVKLFIGNIEAAGLGLTLTAASNVAIIEYPWSPTKVSQAIDRVHRITQTKQVTVWNLVGQDTIEEKIIDILKNKSIIIEKIMDGTSYEDKSVLMELIDSYKQIKK